MALSVKSSCFVALIALPLAHPARASTPDKDCIVAGVIAGQSRIAVPGVALVRSVDGKRSWILRAGDALPSHPTYSVVAIAQSGVRVSDGHREVRIARADGRRLDEGSGAVPTPNPWAQIPADAHGTRSLPLESAVTKDLIERAQRGELDEADQAAIESLVIVPGASY